MLLDHSFALPSHLTAAEVLCSCCAEIASGFGSLGITRMITLSITQTLNNCVSPSTILDCCWAFVGRVGVDLGVGRESGCWPGPWS